MPNLLVHLRGRRRRRSAVLALVLVLSLGAVLLVAGTSRGQETRLGDVPFGPVLFVVDAVDGAPPDGLPPTAVLHARVTAGGRPRFIGSASAADVDQIRSAGRAIQVVDADTSERIYYLVDARAPEAALLAGQVGDLLYQADDVLLVGTTPARELSLIETLPAQGVAISLLTAAPLVPETSGSPAALTAAAAAPDPAVLSLINTLAAADLQPIVSDLSGQRAVSTGGVTSTLTTRYTLAGRVHDAEQYVLDAYTRLGLPVSFYAWTYGSYSGRNVIAEVRGAVHPEQVLLIGGHLDDNSQTPYTLAPGADDNGSGTAVTLQIARLLRAYQPSVTVRFVHFTGEEQGQWGSKVYAAAMRQRSEQIIGFLDLDMIGWDGNKDGVAEIHTGTGPKSNALADAFLDRNNRYSQGLTFERKSTTASRFSDHSPFWDNDYAAFLVIENFFVDAIANDRNPYYHNTGDLPSRVDFDYAARIGRVAMATLIELAGYNVGALPPTATPPAPTPPAPTPTQTPTPTPAPGCVNLVLNGGFESTGSWQFGSTPFAAGYVTSPVYAGARAVRLGIPAGSTNKLAHSSAFQKVAVPADAPTPLVLRFWQRSGGAGDGADYRETLLLNSSYGYLAKLERSYADGSDQWTARSFDLSAYRGRTVVIYFNVYNDGKGSQLWNYVDQVALGNCTAAAGGAAPDLTVSPAPPITATTLLTAGVRLAAAPALVRLGELYGADQVTVTVTSLTGDELAWHAATDAAWMELANVTGATPGGVVVRLNGSLLLAPETADILTGTLLLHESTQPTVTLAVEVEAVLGAVQKVFVPIVERE